MSTDNTDVLHIDRLTLIQYSGLSIHARVINPPLGFLVRLTGWIGDTKMEAFGEVAVPGKVTLQTWQALQEALRSMQGTSIALADWQSQPRGFSQFTPWWTKYRFSNRNEHRFSNLVLESLVLEVLRQTGRLESLGWQENHQRDDPQRRHVVKLPAKASEAHRQQLHGSLGNDLAPIYRLECSGIADRDTEWIAHMADTSVPVADRPMLWLTFAKQLSPAGAEQYLTALADLLKRQDIAPRVIVEDPIPGRQPSHLIRLQKLVDSLQTPHSQLSIASRRDINNPAALKKLLKSGNIGALVLDPNEWGSFEAIRLAAKQIKKTNSSVEVWLNGSGYGSVLTRSHETQLFASSPEIDQFCLDSTADIWPLFAPEEAETPAPRKHAASHIDLLQVAPKINDYVSIPPVPSTDRLAANDFSEDFMPGLPTGMAKQWHLEMAAMQAGLPTRRLGRHLFVIEADGHEPIGFTESQPSDTAVSGRDIAREKGATRDLFDHYELPIAPGFRHPAGDVAGAEKRALEMGFPLVVKPEGGSQGMGITSNIRSVEELRRAFDAVELSRYAGADLIVERHVAGDDYRVIATPDEVLAIIRRDIARVWGDGIRSIDELILEANTLRRRNPNLCRRLIDPDDHLFSTLTGQGYTVDSVPEAGAEVKLSTVANLSQGGTSTEVLDDTHPSILELAKRATRHLDLPFAGVDLLIEDHTQPVAEQSLTITEMNHNAAVLLRYPMYGPPRDVCDTLVRQAAERAGIPVTPAHDQLNITMTVTGHLAESGYAAWVKKTATTLGLNGTVRDVDDDTVEAHLSGPAMRVTGMLCLAHKGSKKSLPLEISTQPAEHIASRGFALQS